MTANQIAAASNEITRSHYERMDELNAEANRINEEHLNRMDTINAERNDLEKRAQDIDLWYKEAMYKIESSYKNSQISLNEYEMKKKDAETQYTVNKTSVDALLANNEVRRTEELTRHNQATESLSSESNAISADSVSKTYDLGSKKLEYQQHQWDTENFLNFERYGLQLKQFELDKDIKYGNLNLSFLAESRFQSLATLERNKFEFDKARFEWQKGAITAQNFANYAKGISDVGGMAANMLLKGLIIK